MLDECNPDGANLGWNIDPVGGQNVDHAHLHLFGRFAQMNHWLLKGYDMPLSNRAINEEVQRNRTPR